MTERALLALQGPEAFAALSRLTTGQWELSALTFMMGGPYQIGGIDAFITRSGYTGEDGFEISIDETEVEKVADLLCAQPEVKPIGLGARDSLRLEAGLPLYGHDLDTNIDPVSADLGFAISKRRRAEGGFPGADRILKYLAEGAPTKRVGFAVEGRLPAREGAEVFAGDTRVGTITSGGFAPTVGAPIAMGYVDAAHAAPGTRLEIEVRGKRLAATVTPMPFVPHHYVRKGAA
jgi:aminomethyltransferase